MANTIHFAILGLAGGGIDALLALGLIVIYRASGAVNFAHAAIALTSGYLLFYFQQIHFPLVLSVSCAVACGGGLGVASQVLVIRPLRNATPLTKAIATLGILVVLQAACQLKFGSDAILVPSFLPENGFTFLGAHLTINYIVIFAVSVIFTVGLWWGYRRSRIGLATSALAENQDALEILGWSSSRVSCFNWAIAGVLAGVAGVFLAPIAGLSLSSMTDLLLPALAAALFGGLRSFPLAFGGALFIGVVQSELTFYGNEPGIRSFPDLSDAIPFLLIIVILVARGTTLPTRAFVGARLPKLGTARLNWRFVVPVLVIVTLLISVFLPVAWVMATTSCLLAGLLLLSLVVLIGYAGQLSLAQVSIAGLGSLVAARLVASAGWPFLAAAAVGVAVAFPVGIIVGLPAVRTRGITLAVVTLGLAEALNDLVFSSQKLTGGEGGLNIGYPEIFGIHVDEFNHPRAFSILALIVFVIVALGVCNLRRSNSGRTLIAVRGNERAAASLGVNVAAMKLYAFVLSSMVATIGGILIAFRSPLALFDSFDPFQSVNYVIESVIGGVGYVGGASAGTSVEPSGLGSKLLSSIGLGSWLLLISGILLLITVIFNPDGIAGSVEREMNRLRRRGKARDKPLRNQTQIVSSPEPDELLQLKHDQPTVLSVASLSVAFGGVVAVNEVSFELRSGEVLGVIGPNGAGKTTLIDAIGGYVKSTGSVSLDGQRIDQTSVHGRSQLGIARSFQSLELFEDLTVGENLLVASERRTLWLHIRNLIWPGKKRLEGVVAAAVEEFGFSEALGKLPSSLSYGQRRLLAICRALAANPRVVMLDEPAAGLDARDRVELQGLLRRLAEEWQFAILLVEHDVDLVMNVSDRVMALNFGRVIVSGDPDDVRRHPEVVRSYLGESQDSDTESAEIRNAGPPTSAWVR